MDNNHWSEMTFQEKLRSFSIILALIFGWGITIAGFILPPSGIVDDSVLIILGQALTYVAVGVGIKEYVDSRLSSSLSRKEREEKK